MSNRQLKNCRAIITGASGGIGWELAEQLAQQGVKLIVNARRASLLDDLTAKIRSAGGCCTPHAGDITVPAVRKALVDLCLKEHGGLDILVNNAGIGAMGRFDEAAPDRMRKIFEVNFFSVAELTRLAIPELKQGVDPLVVNISSVLGHRAAPLKSEYCASKFALHGLSDSLRAELVPNGIELLLVSPSTTESEFFDRSIEDTTDKDWKKGGAMPAEKVAAKTIRAMIKRRHEIILTFGGRIIVWLDRLLPGIANKLVARFGQ
jgi:short-subunit dehydrogenase